MAELVPVEFNPFKKSTTPEDFSARYGAAADKAAKALGVDPKVVLGQWGLETGWGKSVIPGTNNLGNIKDFSGAGTAATDNMTGSRDKYRAYESPDQFVDDYVSLIQRKYPNAVNAKTPEDFAKALKSGGYAEDPGYVAKVTTAAKMTPVKATAADLGYGSRLDGSPKGRGFLGELKRPDGDISTEVSVGVNIDGKEMEIPLLVPSLSRAEIDQVLSLPPGRQPPEAIVRKAAEFAKQRIAQGKNVFADNGESPRAEPQLVPVDFDPFAVKMNGTEVAQEGHQKVAKREKTVAERAVNAIARLNPLGGLVDAATGGRASIGAARGIKDVIDTGAGYLSRLGGADEQARVQAMNQQGKEDFNQTYGDSGAASMGRIAGNVVATLPLTNALGAGAVASGLPRLGNAIASGGMSTGAKLVPGASKVADMAIRMGGGALAGGASAGAVDPASAGTGALIGAALPPVTKGLGMAGSALARTVRGPEVPPNLLAAASQAQEAGYVIPPTQVKPSLGNRLLEGMSGKITTAQNASARNQEVTNRLAKQAIGADELSTEGLAMVRSKANQAYSDLGNFGTIKADDAFSKVVREAGQRAEGFAKDFPELVNKDVEQLVESFANKKTFDSQSAIEAIKRLREGQRAISGNPMAGAEAKAFGRTQGKLADAVESLVERNLAEAKRPELLTAFRDARKTLARVYDVEKAMNPASGTVDARKLGNALKKGRLSDELRTAAEFAQTFPKAAQAVEGMGSLPQLSPLDWATAGGMSAATGSPLGALGLVARPAARAAALSPFVQNRLAQPQGLPMLTQNARQNLLQPLYRSGPVLASDR